VAGHISVLIADDHGVLRDGLRLLLEQSADIRVVAALDNGRDAVRRAKELLPQVAIVDVAMPGLTGIEVARELAREAPPMRVVMLSFQAVPSLVREAFHAGAHGYVLKESAGSEIVRAVRAVAAGRRYVGAGLSEAVIGELASDNPAGFDALTPREREILKLVAEGKTSAQAGAILGLSTRTVETYRGRMMEKLGVRDFASLVKLAIRMGITGDR
jgi:DNA-binding NarL/FixJ family response regulator